MTKTYYNERPLEVDLIPLHGRQIIRIRQNIAEEETEEGMAYSADEIESTIPNTEVTDELIQRIKDADRNRTADEAREKRNILLARSDNKMVADYPCDHEAMAQYRQALRDITLQPGFPYFIEWPEMPI